MKISSYVLLFTILIGSASASHIQHATITFEVLNSPPEIVSLKILPEEPYYDSVLECVPEISDEFPSEVVVEYKWFKNSNPLSEKSPFLGNLKDNDEIRCVALPIDKYGLYGQEMAAETKIKASGLHVKMLSPVLSTIGIKTDARELSASLSMAAVTGMATGYRNENVNPGLTLIFILSVFLFLLLALNASALIIARRARSPKQDSSAA